jgi:hypothetical protein
VNLDPGFGDQKLEEIQLKKMYRFLIKNLNLIILKPPLRTSKLQEKPSALKREHPALQQMKFI